MSRRTFPILLVAVSSILLLSPASATTTAYEIASEPQPADPPVSCRTGGGAADGQLGGEIGTWSIAISSDGRHVAFSSDAADLVPGDTNGVTDIFVRDRLTAATTRVSLSTDGRQSYNAFVSHPVISSDGRHVAFASNSLSVVTGETDTPKPNPLAAPVHPGPYHPPHYVIVRDRDVDGDGVLDEPGSVLTFAVPGGQGQWHSMSGDGRIVVHEILGPSGNTSLSIYDRDADGDAILDEPGAVSTTPVPGGAYPAVTADGRQVAFQRRTGSASDYRFAVYDVVSGQTTDIATVLRPRDSYAPALSATGRFVAMDSSSPAGLHLIDRDADADSIFDEPGQSTTVLVTDKNSSFIGERGIALAGDGSKLLFGSIDPSLDPAPTSNSRDVYGYDVVTGDITRLSVPEPDVAQQPTARGSADSAVISHDGSVVAFMSSGPLVASDRNDVRDVYVKANGPGSGGAEAPPFAPVNGPLCRSSEALTTWAAEG